MTTKLSYDATFAYMSGISLSCGNGCSSPIMPPEQGGDYKNILIDIYIPPVHGSCEKGDQFGQALPGGLAYQFSQGKGSNIHSMPHPLDRDDLIVKAKKGMYTLCIPIWKSMQIPGPTFTGWSALTIMNWPMAEEEHNPRPWPTLK